MKYLLHLVGCPFVSHPLVANTELPQSEFGWSGVRYQLSRDGINVHSVRYRHLLMGGYAHLRTGGRFFSGGGRRRVEGVNKAGNDEVLWNGDSIAETLWVWVLGRRAWCCRGRSAARARVRVRARGRGQGQTRARGHGDGVGVGDDERDGEVTSPAQRTTEPEEEQTCPQPLSPWHTTR